LALEYAGYNAEQAIKYAEQTREYARRARWCDSAKGGATHADL